MFGRFPSIKPIFVLAMAAGLCLPAAQSQSSDDHPVLRHRDRPMPDQPKDDTPAPISMPEVAPGLSLPLQGHGHALALDTADGKPHFVDMELTPTFWNQHPRMTAEESRQAYLDDSEKVTLEVNGHSSAVRLNDPGASFFVSRVVVIKDPSKPQDREKPRFVLVKLLPQEGHRVASTVWISGRLVYKDSVIPVASETERVGRTTWFKITPGQKLAPGEYALLPLSKETDGYPAAVLDFGVGPASTKLR